MAQQDSLGRELTDSTKGPQTVTQFAVEQGTVPKDGAGVQDTIRAEKRAAEEGTKRAERVSEAMAPQEPAPGSPAAAGDTGGDSGRS
jgi:hypothetical protein